jgi:hypothetical protein
VDDALPPHSPLQRPRAESVVEQRSPWYSNMFSAERPGKPSRLVVEVGHGKPCCATSLDADPPPTPSVDSHRPCGQSPGNARDVLCAPSIKDLCT